MDVLADGLGPSSWFWVMVITCCGMWTFVSIVRIVTEAIVRVRAQKHEIEREYLREMMAEISEIKQRLDARSGINPGE